MSRRTRALLAGFAAGGTLLTLSHAGSAAPAGPGFDAPVKVTPPAAGGYEPGIVSDRSATSTPPRTRRTPSSS